MSSVRVRLSPNKILMMTYFSYDLFNYSIIILSICLGFFISVVVWFASYFIAIQSPDPEKTSAYECGFEPFEDARNRFDVRFYIVAILFLIFDVEVIFFYPWTISLGLTGFWGYFIIVLFLVLLVLGFIYEIVKGALDMKETV